MRLIDADHLRRWILSRVFKSQLSVADVIDQIDREDTIEPQQTGRWIPLQLSMAYPPYQCSCCFGNAPMVMVGTGRLKKGHLEALLTDFCPSCGARMEGES